MPQKIKNNIKKKLFLETMEKTFGNVTQSCKIVGIDRSLPYKWAEQDKKFAEIFYSNIFEEIYLDMIESKLAKLALEENPTILIFLAKTKGKRRAYIEKQEIVGDIKTETVQPIIPIIKFIDD